MITVEQAWIPDEAAVTSWGICHGGHYYTCSFSIRMNWYHKSSNEGSWNIPILYFKEDPSSILLVLEDGEQFAAYRISRQKPGPAAEAYFARMAELKQAYSDRKKRGKQSLKGLMK